jgi:hypothetical protein
MHEIEIWHDPQYSRPFCVLCECGWNACCLSEREAVRARDIHSERNSPKIPLTSVGQK